MCPLRCSRKFGHIARGHGLRTVTTSTVSERGTGRIDARNRGHAVEHAADERHVHGRLERERSESPPRNVLQPRLAARHVLPTDEHHEDPVDAVAVHPLGRGHAGLGAGLDAELVDLHVEGGGVRDEAAERRAVADAARITGCEATSSWMGRNHRSTPPFSGL